MWLMMMNSLVHVCHESICRYVGSDRMASIQKHIWSKLIPSCCWKIKMLVPILVSIFIFWLVTMLVFWAEEGNVVGQWELQGYKYFCPLCSKPRWVYDSGTPVQDQEPVSYVKTSSVKSGNYTYTTIDLSLLNPKAIRTGTFTDPIVSHTEHSGRRFE